MEVLKRLLLVLALVALPILPALAAELPYRVICYHDVRDDVADDYDPDQYAVSTARLIEQFAWLRDHGYHAVSLDQIIAARTGREALPDKAVLLTFDDGLASTYTHVFPLLKMFEYPAVVGVVTSWIEQEEFVDYAGKTIGADGFMTWEQMREMQASGLVEFASHSHDMHKGVRGNPQGSLQPAAKTRFFDGSRYETEEEFRRRIGADLELSVDTIGRALGRKPRVIVWPYGAYNILSESVAAELGMHVTMTLDPSSRSNDETLRLGRYLVTANPDLGDFSAELLAEEKNPIVRVAQVDLDFVYDVDPLQQQRNLDQLLDRIKALEISHVFLQAFVDDDADGGASAVYFPNRHLPVRADLFNFVAWQLKTRARVSVYAWMPMLSFAGEAFDPDWRVLERRDELLAPDPNSEPRLSPFNEEARRRIGDVYEDLAAYSHFAGVLLHDDGRLSDLEDFSTAAVAHYTAEFGREIDPDILDADARIRQRWAELKAQQLLEFGGELLERVRAYQPEVKSARNIFASALLDEAGPEYLAQDFDAFLQTYDFVALMAMPSMEGARDDRQFYKHLVDAVRSRDDGLERTIFELQTVDWSRSEPIPGEELRSTMRWLQSIGVRNLGYYPDNFIEGQPDFDQLRLGMSLADDFAGPFR